MSNKKLIYKSPSTEIVKMAVAETLLITSPGATIEGVEIEDLDYDF